MKTGRTLGALLLAAGCAAAFVGLVAILLSHSSNAQVGLVVASFDEPSRFWLVGAVGACMRFAMRHGWLMIAGGAAGIALGGWMVAHFTAAAPKQPQPVYEKPAETPAVAEPVTVQPVEEDNPFAVVTAPEPCAMPDFAPSVQASQSRSPGFVLYDRPMLDANLVDEPPARTPVTFETESRAVVSETGSVSPSGARVILRTPQPPVPDKTPAPVKVDAPQPIRPRIKSTMGKHTLS